MPKSKKPIIKNMPKRRRTKWRKKSRMHFSMSLCRYEGDGSDNIEMNMRIPSDDPVKAIRIIAEFLSHHREHVCGREVDAGADGVPPSHIGHEIIFNRIRFMQMERFNQ